ncbi:unnamed protein product [Adineta ricciae]|uniref:Uncharacterized protein n=1 Tax=Adineta ricciae TaxID=249248 RepID=A0A813YZK5_ADIRI|nr:unnamed protein product [Adineta ricciae]
MRNHSFNQIILLSKKPTHAHITNNNQSSSVVSTLNLDLFENELFCFPNPPQKPPSNASPDEQALFWKLLHNYYAIIARPRFGKRSESFVKHPSYLETGHFDSAPSASSEYDMDRFNHPINVDSVYTFENSDKKRRRRR